MINSPTKSRREAVQLRTNWERAVIETARLAAGIEGIQMDVSRAKRRLEELDRLSTQIEFSGSIVAGHADKLGLNTGTLGRQTRTARHDKNQRCECICGRAVEQRLHGGTHGNGRELGPAYGRVDVKGLTVLEAEAAITKHLAKVIEGPQVQVTMIGKHSTEQELNELLRTIAAMQVENAELKKQMEQLKAQEAGASKQPSSPFSSHADQRPRYSERRYAPIPLRLAA